MEAAVAVLATSDEVSVGTGESVGVGVGSGVSITARTLTWIGTPWGFPMGAGAGYPWVPWDDGAPEPWPEGIVTDPPHGFPPSASRAMSRPMATPIPRLTAPRLPRLGIAIACGRAGYPVTGLTGLTGMTSGECTPSGAPSAGSPTITDERCAGRG